MNQAGLKRELLKKVNQKSEVEIEKVERYCNLIKYFYQLDKFIKDDGLMITIKNGAQEFTKANPAIAEKNRINAQLINLSKDLGISAPPPGAGDKNKTGYSPGDLT